MANLSFDPRLNSSKQWTEIPKEFTSKVAEVFRRQFGIEAQHGKFMVEGRIYPEEMILRVGYLEEGRLRQLNFEASMDLSQDKSAETVLQEAAGSADSDVEALENPNPESDTMRKLYTCVDAIGSMFEELFDSGEDDEDLDLPLRWRPYDFEGSTVYLQLSTINTDLESEADRILEAAGDLPEKRLFQEQGSSEDALARADIDSELSFAVQEAIRSGTYVPKIPGFDAAEATGDESEH